MNNVIGNVYAVLSTTPERWQRLSTLPADLLTRQPAEGEWSALNCLEHLLDTERVLFPVRVRALLSGHGFVNFNPNQRHVDSSTLTPEQIAEAFAQTRQESLDMLKQVTEEDLKLTAQHPKQGTVTLAELLNTWAGHDLMHTVQGERALMQPFMLDCGSWRHFFWDHEVKSPDK